MRGHLRKIRKSKITKGELVGDAIFLLVSLVVSFLLVLLFDVHHSFYEYPPKLVFIFKSLGPYILYVPLGAIFIFFIIKLILFGFREEEK